MTGLTKVCAAVVALVCVAPVSTVRAAAPAGRYTKSTGTVLDTKTNLIWQQPAAPSQITWAAAKSYCAALGATLGGNGWRLPTMKELDTLVDVSVSPGPAIDTTYFPGTASSLFWSSTPASTSSSFSWIVSFADGTEGQISNVSGSAWVRCVR